jgi:hypothetical protein
MALMFDAAFPPAKAPAGYSAVAGYIGGDTPHVWSHEEWARFGSLRKLPIYVRSSGGNAVADATSALISLYSLGVPKNKAMALDLETQVNPSFVNEFVGIMNWVGYKVWVYGSASTVFKNPPGNGYWVADYTGSPFMYNHAKVRATQYASNQSIDSSLIKTWQYTFGMWK